MVGFQPQAVDILDLGSVHPPSKFSISPKNMYASENKVLTKDRQWEHLRQPVWEKICPYNLGTMYSNYSLSPMRYERQ